MVSALLIMVLGLLLISCLKPDYKNPFDPNSGFDTTPMQGELTLTQLTDSQVQLGWQLNSSIEGSYIIERSINNGTYDLLAEVGPEINTFTDTALVTSNTYYYHLIGANDEIHTEPLSDSISTNFAPLSAFTIVQQNIHTNQLYWTHDCEYEEGYSIERREISATISSKSEKAIKKEKSRDFIQIADLPANSTSYIDETLTPRVEYEYRIFAYTTWNESPDSTDQILMDFPAPNDLTIVQDDVHTFTLNWQDNSAGEDGFTIERKIDSDDYELIYTTGENETTFTDDINIRDQFDDVYYKIKAIYQSVLSDSVSSSSAITFAAPTYVGYQYLTILSLQIDWQDNSIAEDGFAIDKKVGSAPWQEGYDTVGEDIEQWIDTAAEVNATLKYRIYAFSGNNQSDAFETPEILNAFPPPSNLTIAQNDVHTFTLNWQDNSIGEEGFSIERKIDSGTYELIFTTGENITAYVDDINVRDQFDTIYYRLKAIYQAENSLSVEGSLSIGFPAPAYAGFDKITINSIEISWVDNSNDEDGFYIDKQVGTAAWQMEYDSVGPNVEEWIDTAAEINETLKYRIYAYSGNNQSDYFETPGINNTFPAPTNLLINQDNVHTFTLNWQDNSTGEEGFTVERKIDSGVYILINTTAQNVTTYTDDINVDDQFNTVFYRITAFYQSDFSAGLENSHSLAFPAPTYLDYDILSITSIQLTWQDNSSGEEGFYIDKKVGTNPWQIEFANVGENIETWTDTAAEVATILQYKVYAYSDINQSNSVETDEINNIFPAPTLLQYQLLTITSIQLTWQDNSTGEEGFKIDKKVGTNDWQLEYASVGESIETWTETNAEPNEILQYRVYAYHGTNNTSSLQTGNINNVFSAPSALQYERLTISDIHLTWSDNSNGETGFKIDKKLGGYDWFEDYDIVNENAEEWTDTNANLNWIIQYRIHAYYDGYSSRMIETGVIDNSIPVPGDFTLTGNDTEITLDWTYSLAGIDGFKLARSVTGGTWNENYASFTSSEFQFTDTGLAIGQSYSYKIRAYSGTDYSEYTMAVYYAVAPAGMVYMQGGDFEMGDHFGEGNANELPVHPISLDSYYIAKNEITHADYINFLNDFGVNSNGTYNGSELIAINDANCAIAHNGTNFYFAGNFYAQYEECSVMLVTWYGAVVYCNWLSQQEGITACYDLTDWSCDFTADGYRLPTEAEWEYAARGGVEWLDNYRFSGCHEEADLPDYAWYSVNSGGRVQEVGTKIPNQLGIFDMSGNVSEWCYDWYDETYYSVSSVTNPTGPTTGTMRSVRNGDWQGYYGYCRTAYRFSRTPGSRTITTGFRVVRPF